MTSEHGSVEFDQSSLKMNGSAIFVPSGVPQYRRPNAVLRRPANTENDDSSFLSANTWGTQFDREWTESRAA